MKNHHHNNPIHPKPPAHEDVALRAYFIWLESGRPEHSDDSIWLEAERQLHAQGTQSST